MTLTKQGKDLLDAHRRPDHEPAQAFHAGVLRTRELGHDTQVYRAFERSAQRQAERDARILRVVLEQDHDYVTEEDVNVFAAARPGSEVVTIPDAGHLAFLDNPEATNGAIRRFLLRVER